MRKSLFTAVAMAPLMLFAIGGAAQATTTISGNTTNQIRTSTAASGAPDDVVIDAGATVQPTAGPAVVVDSNNTFTNNGTVKLNNLDNSTVLQIVTPHTGDVTNAGAINNVEDYVATDTNGDGVLDGAWAQGTNRYGIQMLSGGTYTSNLINSGSVTVQGNNSFGIDIEAPIVGNLTNSGSINITGDNSFGLRTTQSITGNVLFTGGITGNGGGVQGANLGGDISGSLAIYSTITTTGYRLTTRPADPTARGLLLPEDLLQAGSALTVAGDVTGGVFLGAPPAIATGAAADQDNDHDGIPDAQEGASDILVYGQAPAVLIGATGRDVHLGEYGTAANGNAYGLIIRGSVDGFGVYDNIAGNAVQIGTGDGTVHIDGGIDVIGGIQSTAIQANATGIHFLSGAETPTLVNSGVINTTMATTASTVAPGTPPEAHTILIDQGASLGSISNVGTISAIANSDDGSAYAIQDKSGTLTSIVNSNTISAITTPITIGVTPTGRAVAIDASANTTGVSIVQNPFLNADGTTSTTVTPIILGDVLLGSGNDSVALHAGDMGGALDFGTGTDALLIDGGATYAGALTAEGTLNIDLAAGEINDRSASTIAANTLHVGSTSSLYFAIDPVNDKATEINVSGAAVIDAGAKLGVNLLSLPQGDQIFTVVKAGQLTVGSSDADILATTPYLFVITPHTDTDAGTIDLEIRRRTAEEAGFNRAETAAYDAVYNDLPRDTGILNAIVSQTSQQGLLGLYDQLLPDHAGGVTRALSASMEAAENGAADWPHGENSPGPTRGWTQEIGMGENKDRADASAWRIYGFGAAGGVESMSPSGGALGLMTSFTSSNVNNPDTPGDDAVDLSQITLGAYWRAAFHNLHLDVQGGAGYVWAHTRRELIYSDSSQLVHRLAQADWSGWSAYARGGLAYELALNNLDITPGVHLDYYRLNEGGYTEDGGGDGYDLSVQARNSNVLSLTGSVVIGYSFGERTHIRPEIEVGYRQVISGTSGSTTGNFVGAPDIFTLLGEPIKGGGPIGRVGVRVFNDWLDLKLDAGTEVTDLYTDLDVRITVRLVF